LFDSTPMERPSPHVLLAIPVLFLVGLASIASACAGGNEPGPGGDAGAPNGRTSANPCITCANDSDCSAGGVCAQLGGDRYCTPPCAAGRACSADRACSSEVSASGGQVDVCVSRGDLCGHSSQPSSDGGGATSVAASGAATGSVGPRGGNVSRLYFAVVGDTRPPSVDDTSGYPSAIITKIFQDLQSLDPVPLFGLSTGDYMFASTHGGQAAPQLALYLYARTAFSGIMFPAMGNHECTGATASNCGSGNSDGVTDNYSQFLAKMLKPLGQTQPYYSFGVDSSSGAWTAKFVVVAANAWDNAQAAWLEATLARATTYTFIVRHEPAAASTAPGVNPAEQIQSQHPYTLSIVGHSHTYAKSGAKEVIIGNGGAPLTSSGANYGFGLVEQRDDGSIQFDVVDYATMQRDTRFTFAVRPDGSPMP
jgi:hypothetical protein